MSGIRSHTLAGIFLSGLLGALLPASGAFAELLFDTPDLALTGRETSAQEGVMEGVLVSAQRNGSPISVNGVSNKAGRYSFPVDRLTSVHYALSIRAIGCELHR